MNNIIRKIILFLFLSLTVFATVLAADNDEDKDIGIGGTGMLANTDNGYGLGGTGIIGEITGYGSIFVNGIEIEYDDTTPFTLDGKTVTPIQLEIGDIVEVLTTDAEQHTQAQIINLRHEVIGIVESVEPQTYSFTVQGQSIIQSIDKSTLPEVGTTVAVAGFRIDEQTILSTRIVTAEKGQTLLRTHTELPFTKLAKRWLVQTRIQNNKAILKQDGTTHSFPLKEKFDGSIENQLGIKILQFQRSVNNEIELDQTIEPKGLPRGRRTLAPVQQRSNDIIRAPMPGPILMPHQGAVPAPSQVQKSKNGR